MRFVIVFFLFLFFSTSKAQKINYSIISYGVINNDNVKIPKFERVKGLIVVDLKNKIIEMKDGSSSRKFEILDEFKGYATENDDYFKEFDAYDYLTESKCEIMIVIMANPPLKSPSETQIYFIFEKQQLVFYLNEISIIEN